MARYSAVAWMSASGSIAARTSSAAAAQSTAARLLPREDRGDVEGAGDVGDRDEGQPRVGDDAVGDVRTAAATPAIA